MNRVSLAEVFRLGLLERLAGMVALTLVWDIESVLAPNGQPKNANTNLRTRCAELLDRPSPAISRQNHVSSGSARVA
jgi:hypothetical protein